ncbi:iron-sulfur cluster co-chaperone protein HscB-like [Ochotona princeps]|uniref:iron-sulfur cluster co-chaperone protein HscB-like n=1 Tax=Ochotona princeps TaxID=9978 RepID=UPI002714EC61|nr:iron-sulfur cluster co-chaperone protein HscB-like [Ochotona princeps]
MDNLLLMELAEINEKLAGAQSEAAPKETESIFRDTPEELTEDVSKALEQDDFEKAEGSLTKTRYYSDIGEKIKLKKITL